MFFPNQILYVHCMPGMVEGGMRYVSLFKIKLYFTGKLNLFFLFFFI